ncbi:MAG TPA: NAD-dependent epimerase/dehydratase family protein [Myxococcales bacterium]|nr:NAD-dependent epimerase/dehydratase family protein [Myxococcales bacterium]
MTGAGGFLGHAVVEALGPSAVRAIAGPGDARLPAAASVARVEIRDRAALQEALAGAETVVHLAGPASVAASFLDPLLYLQVHAEGTAALLEACRGAGVTRVVHVSSAEVYGRPRRNPVDEDHPLSARSPYAAAKIAAEKLIEAATHAHGLRAVVLRPFSIYGPGASPDSLIPRIIGQVLERKQEIVLRDLRPVRDYCFVGDLAAAVAAACACDLDGFAVFNVGTSSGSSVAQIAQMILEAGGSSARVVESRDKDRPGASEILELVADNRRALSDLHWKPAVPLHEGLRRTLEGLRK